MPVFICAAKIKKLILPQDFAVLLWRTDYEIMLKTNYHTHTARCHHAVGSDEDYVLSAIAGGFRVLGFSDHTPWKYDSPFVPEVRMMLDELPGYLASVRALREKYRDRIEIRVGLECEYFPEYMPWLWETIRRERLDYVIFGNHFYESDERYPYFGMHTRTLEMLEMYEESVLKGMEAGMFAYLAHPDLFINSYKTFDEHCARISRRICRKAYRTGLPLEYNVSLLGYREERGEVMFPQPDFWKIAADEGCTAIVGMDAHDNRMLENTVFYERGVRALRELNIKTIDTIPYFSY